MYNKFTNQLIDDVPELFDSETNDYKRELTKAYVLITQLKLKVDSQELMDKEIENAKFELRRIADTMESIAVFDKLNGIEISKEIESACAFVAAEALSLLYKINLLLAEDMNEVQEDYFTNEKNYIAFESAFLYMISGFDINAKSLLEDLENIEDNILDNQYLNINNSSKVLFKTIFYFINGDFSREVLFSGEAPPIDYEDDYIIINKKIRTHFYSQISQSVILYIKWLIGEKEEGCSESIEMLIKIRTASSTQISHQNMVYSDIYHFSSILIAAIQKTKTRSLIHQVPQIENGTQEFIDTYNGYLRKRAKGTLLKTGRPLLWPSALSYVESCLPGPNKDCVITMPTGSGKSFIAELAIAQALASGWVLYIAPTNALVHQIRRDLKDDLSDFSEINIRSFVGGEEYTSLSEENIDIDEKFIAVMTPEKCALAIRLYPDLFESCALCVFDECHLLNDENRGTNADILLTSLIRITKNMKLLLMSAMISNGDVLADWLNKVHGQNAICKSITWRPTRTLRSMVAVDNQNVLQQYPIVKEKANRLSKNRVNLYFNTPLLLISGLLGPWTVGDTRDYKISRINTEFEVRVSKNLDGPNFDSWKNTVSRLISEDMAKSGIPVINFIMTSKHHVFSSAEKSLKNLNHSLDREGEMPGIVTSLLALADAELGLPSVLWELFSRGITVHTSSMLQVEQTASEYVFSKGLSKLMFATGTLAQGLNLPAVSVVVAGTSMGDPRESDNLYGLTDDRAKSTILNAFGRAGRPGYGHHGNAILVSDDPILATIGSQRFRSPVGADIMRAQDAAVEVHSPIEYFIGNITDESFYFEEATNEELTLAALLVELDKEVEIDEVLQNTLGAHQITEDLPEDSFKKARLRILKIKQDFFDANNSPEWLSIATMKAGVSFYRSQEMWRAYQQIGLADTLILDNLSLQEWLEKFIDVMTNMHPKYLKFIPGLEVKTQTILTKMRDYISGNRLLEIDEFIVTEEWKGLWLDLGYIIQLYMDGESYKVIAEALLNKEVINFKRNDGRHPLPTIFKFIKEVIDPIAMDAGCFLALNEHGVYEEKSTEIPEELQGLPLAIKNGCDSLETLAWFRFGIRQRVAAHKLNRSYSLPLELTNDELKANWVREKRLEFLSSEVNDQLLESIRQVILNVK